MKYNPSMEIKYKFLIAIGNNPNITGAELVRLLGKTEQVVYIILSVLRKSKLIKYSSSSVMGGNKIILTRTGGRLYRVYVNNKSLLKKLKGGR
jgi:hypothetical protein